MNNTKILHPCIGSTGYFQRPDVANALRPPPAALFEQRLIKKHYYSSIKSVKPVVQSKFQGKSRRKNNHRTNRQRLLRTKTSRKLTMPSLSSSLKSTKKPSAKSQNSRSSTKDMQKGNTNAHTNVICTSPIKVSKADSNPLCKGSILYPLSYTAAKKRQAKLRVHNRKKRLKKVGNRDNTVKSPVEKPLWNDNVYSIPKPKPEIPINRHPNKLNVKPALAHSPTASYHTGGIPGIKKLGKNIHPAWKKNHKGKALLRDMFGNLEVNQDKTNDESFRYMERLKEYRLKDLHNRVISFKKKKNLKKLQEKVTRTNHTDDDGIIDLQVPAADHHSLPFL